MVVQVMRRTGAPREGGDEQGGRTEAAPPIRVAGHPVGLGDGLRGFRTPALLISPFARRARTSHHLYDHTSHLRLIEWRWSLEPLTVQIGRASCRERV